MTRPAVFFMGRPHPRKIRTEQTLPLTKKAAQAKEGVRMERDRNRIKTDYVTTSVGYRDLAEEYGAYTGDTINDVINIYGLNVKFFDFFVIFQFTIYSTKYLI